MRAVAPMFAMERLPRVL